MFKTLQVKVISQKGWKTDSIDFTVLKLIAAKLFRQIPILDQVVT